MATNLPAVEWRPSPGLQRIDWRLLAEAVGFYERLGYHYVEVPYAVPKDIIRLTLPPEYDDAVQPVEPFGCLVGSAEQSLLSMDLAPGSYVACSPCFRPEPVVNELNQYHFMKVELFQTGVDSLNPMALLMDAKMFMSQFAELEVLRTDQGKDLMVAGIEVGSYGRREAAGRVWACGTGLALPRFDVARQKQMQTYSRKHLRLSRVKVN
jgi:hypothetical protein